MYVINKILAAATSAAICISIVLDPINSIISHNLPVAQLNASAAPVHYDDPDTYVADKLKNDIDLESGKIDTQNAEYNKIMERQFAYDRMAEYLMKDKGLVTLSGIWSGWDAVASGDFKSLSETEVYEVLIMDYLMYEAKDESYQSEMLAKTARFEGEIWKQLVETIKAEKKDYTEDMAKKLAEKIHAGENLSAEEMNLFHKSCDDLAQVNKISEYTQYAEPYIKAANSCNEYCENLSKVFAVKAKDEDRQAFLLKMKEWANKENDKAFCDAVDKVLKHLNASKVSLMFTEGIETIASTWIENAWDRFVDEVPYFAAFKIGICEMDVLFNSSSQAADDYKLMLLYSMETYAVLAVRDNSNCYFLSHSRDDAEDYITSFRHFMKFQEYASDWSRKFVADTVLEGLGNQIYSKFFDDQKITYNDYMEEIDQDIWLCERVDAQIEMWYDNYQTFSNSEQNAPMNYQEAYAKFLKSQITIDAQNTMFDLYDVDGNGIPELFISLGTSQYTNGTVYTYKDNEIKKLDVNIADGGQWNVRKNLIYRDHWTRGVLFTTCWQYEYGVLSEPVKFESNEIMEVDVPYFKINEIEVSKEEYDSEMNKYLRDNGESLLVGRQYALTEEVIDKVLVSQTWHESYENILRTGYAKNKDLRFSLVDINNDNVPELVTAEGSFHACAPKVYTYNQGGTSSIDCGSNGQLDFNQSKNVLLSSFVQQNIADQEIIGINNGAFQSLIKLKENCNNPNFPSWFIDDMEATETAYLAEYSKWEFGGAEWKKMTYDIDMVEATEENIQKYLVWEKEVIEEAPSLPSGKWVDVTFDSCSYARSCIALTDYNELYVWGRGEYDNGKWTAEGRLSPQIVTFNQKIKDICCSYVLTEDDEVYYLSYNDDKPQPQLVMTDVDKLYPNAAITKQGELYLLGSYKFDGNGNDTRNERLDETAKVKVKGLTDVVSAYNGGWVCAAVTADGSLYTWGSNEASQSYGNGHLGYFSHHTEYSDTQQLELFPQKVDIADVAHARFDGLSDQLYILQKDGTLRKAEYSYSGESISFPVVAEGITSFSCAASYRGVNAVFTITDNSLYAYGTSIYGFGDGKEAEFQSGEKVQFFSNVQSIIAADENFAVLTKDKKLYTWGSNENGVVGNGNLAQNDSGGLGEPNSKDVFIPYEVPSPRKNLISDVEGEFKYRGVFVEEQDSTADFIYHDSYFHDDARTYNPSLATMSLCLELSSWSSYDSEEWPDKDAKNPGRLKNAVILLNKTGFKDFDWNPMWEKTPTNDSIGVVTAHKTIYEGDSNYELIAVAIRGGGYGSEWASNFTLGTNGEHRGFAEARDNVFKHLQQYISNQNITGDVKLWVVGFSRAGATANMLTGSLDDGTKKLEGVKLNAQKDIFCYTFEAPQGGLTSKLGSHADYSNIHNSLNTNDLVPKVAPSCWGFTRYHSGPKPDENVFPSGIAQDKDYELKKQQMLKQLDRVTRINGGSKKLSESYKVKDTVNWTQPVIRFDPTKICSNGDVFSCESITLYEKPSYEILDDSTEFIFRDILSSRSIYVGVLEEKVRILTGIWFYYDENGNGKHDEITEKIFTKENLTYILNPLYNPLYNIMSDGEKNKLAEVKKRAKEIAYRELGSYIQDSTDLERAVNAFVDVIYNIVSMEYELFTEGKTSLERGVSFIQFLTCELASGSVGQAHYPEICMAWLRAEDPNYAGKNIIETEHSQVTRKVTVKCPVDVYVYDDAQNIACKIVDNTPTSYTILCAVNENEEKICYLPGNGSYTVKIKATGDGTVNYTVSEYDCIQAAEIRVENYYDILISEGDELTAVIPVLSQNEYCAPDTDGSNVSYELKNQSGAVLTPDDKLCGTEIAENHFEVTVLAEGNGGVTNGGGQYLIGELAKVEANLLPGSKFYGWYDNEKLLSEEPIYRFIVREDIELTAKFDALTFFNFDASATEGGTVEAPSGSYCAGIKLELKASPTSGYEFDHWESDQTGSFDNTIKNETFYTMTDAETNVTAIFHKTATSVLEVGDVNVDGVINAKDASEVLIAAAKIGTGNGSGLTPELEALADVNSDGSINAKDANTILRYAAAIGTGVKAKITDYI